MDASKNSKSPRVLIVDDMRVNCLILSSLLTEYGVESDIAESGEKCLQLYRQYSYDLILLDHRMPNTDGVETLVQLKETFRKNGREVPIICHTTEDARPNVNLYKAAGFIDVLFKPINPQKLSEMLIAYLPEIKNTKVRNDKDYFEEEKKKLPDWLLNFSGLDINLGLNNCSTARDYLDALAIFATSVLRKSKEIEDLLNKENYSLYNIKMDALCNMSYLIGAKELCDRAADMIYAGKHGDMFILREMTPVILQDYLKFQALLPKLKAEHNEEAIS